MVESLDMAQVHNGDQCFGSTAGFKGLNETIKSYKAQLKKSTQNFCCNATNCPITIVNIMDPDSTSSYLKDMAEKGSTKRRTSGEHLEGFQVASCMKPLSCTSILLHCQSYALNLYVVREKICVFWFFQWKFELEFQSDLANLRNINLSLNL